MTAALLSRRRLVTGLAVAPIISLPINARAASISAAEAEFVALAPTLVPMLDEFDKLWEPAKALYDAAFQASPHEPWSLMEASPGWKTYIESRVPAETLSERIGALVEPFFDERFTSFEAILLRHRYGMSFEAWEEWALDDLNRLWGRECA